MPVQQNHITSATSLLPEMLNGYVLVLWGFPPVLLHCRISKHIFFACFSKDSDGNFIMPLDVEVESMRYIIVYDSSTHSLSDSGKTLPFLTCYELC